MSPELKIIIYIFFVVTFFLIKSSLVYLITLFIVLVLLFRVPFVYVKKGWLPIGIFLVFTFLSNIFFHHGKVLYSRGWILITEEGLNMAYMRTLRVFLMVFGAKILTATTPIEVLVKALGRSLRPLGKIGLPVDDFLDTMGLTLKCFPKLKDFLSENYMNHRDSDEARGFLGKVRIISSFLMPMFIQSMKSPEIFFGADIEKD